MAARAASSSGPRQAASRAGGPPTSRARRPMTAFPRAGPVQVGEQPPAPRAVRRTSTTAGSNCVPPSAPLATAIAAAVPARPVEDPRPTSARGDQPGRRAGSARQLAPFGLPPAVPSARRSASTVVADPLAQAQPAGEVVGGEPVGLSRDLRGGPAARRSRRAAPQPGPRSDAGRPRAQVPEHERWPGHWRAEVDAAKVRPSAPGPSGRTTSPASYASTWQPTHASQRGVVDGPARVFLGQPHALGEPQRQDALAQHVPPWAAPCPGR